MTAKKLATFIEGGRRVTVMDINEDELDEVLETLAKEIEALLEENIKAKASIPGFKNDFRNR